MNFLQDQNGNFSSKRLMGFIGFIVGMLGLMFIGAFSIFKVPASPETAIECFKTVIYVSGILLGVGVFEFFGKR